MSAVPPNSLDFLYPKLQNTNPNSPHEPLRQKGPTDHIRSKIAHTAGPESPRSAECREIAIFAKTWSAPLAIENNAAFHLRQLTNLGSEASFHPNRWRLALNDRNFYLHARPYATNTHKVERGIALLE
jgi:hypothetical protein